MMYGLNYDSLLIFSFSDKNLSDMDVIWVTYKSGLHENF